MQVGEKVIGVIATYHPDKEHLYGQDELDVLSAMARQAAIAIDNARLYYDINQSLEALVDFGEKVTSGIDLTEDEILELIYQQASQLMDTDNMYIALYDDETEMITFPLMYINGVEEEIPARKFGERGLGKTECLLFKITSQFFMPRGQKLKNGTINQVIMNFWEIHYHHGLACRCKSEKRPGE